MGILDGTDTTTFEQKKEQTRKRLIASMKSLFDQIKNVYVQNFNQVWHNPQGLSPQDVFDAFDTNAVEFFTLAYTTYQFINSIQPGTLDLPAPLMVQPNPDGTMTVIPESSSSHSSVSNGDPSSDSSVSSASGV